MAEKSRSRTGGREDRPRSEGTRAERPRKDRPREDRPRVDRPGEDRPREDRPRGTSGSREAGRPMPGGSTSSELLEMADALEMHARELIVQARKLQRMARGPVSGSGTSRTPEKSTRPGTGERASRSEWSGAGGTGGGQKKSAGAPRAKERDSSDEGTRRPRRSEKTPGWAPEPRKPKR
jgi:23S rRNA pseudouridine2605 synthase